MPIERKTLQPRSGNGAVPTGVYTLLCPANPKRNWFSCQVPVTEADTCLLVLSNAQPQASVEFCNILIHTGEAVVLSMTGDMPWQGAVWATGLTAESTVYWNEMEDYP